MASTSVSSIRPGKTAPRDGFLAPALAASIAIAIFAVVTQLLASTGATSLSTTQQLTMWFAAGGLIVLLWIAYMACHAYVTARAETAGAEQARQRLNEALAAQALAEQKAKDAQEQLAQARQDAEQQKDRAEKAEAEAKQARQDAEQQKDRAEKAEAEAKQARQDAEQARAAAAKAEEEQRVALAKLAVAEHVAKVRPPTELREKPPGGPGGFAHRESPAESPGVNEDAWVPPEEFRFLDGSEHLVDMTKMFPNGCYLEPDSIRPAQDKLTGQQVYQCRILDLNPALKDRPHETVVKIPVGQMPDPPSMPQFAWAEFNDLTITGYVIDRNPMRIRYSLRATSIHLTPVTAVRVPAMWTAADSQVEGAKAPHQTAAGL